MSIVGGGEGGCELEKGCVSVFECVNPTASLRGCRGLFVQGGR